MKLHARQLFWSLLIFLPLVQLQGQGNNNPTGPSGDFSGRINTGCSYDPYTGNAKRVVHDMAIPGAVGAYPLRWTRVANSRVGLSSGSIAFGHGGNWNHSYNWSISLFLVVRYPDGRLVPFGDENEVQPGIYQGPPGVSDRLEVLAAPEGNNPPACNLLLGDGGKVCFRRVQRIVDGYPIYSTVATKIVDPYLQETTLTYTPSGVLDRITEPAGRYLKLNYITLPWQAFKPIGSVHAYDGRGNVTQSVTYTYLRTVNNQAHLARVDYSDGTHASYTYQSNHLLATCDDVRYPGPMSKILYEYMPGNTLGQLKSERNATTGQVVSQIAYPTDTVRVETRGDGPSRTFTYDDEGRLVNYTDFKGQTSSIAYDGYGYAAAFTDARGPGYTTTMLREGNIGAVSVLTHPDGSFRGFAYSDGNNPYFVQIRGDERGHNTYFTRDDHNRITKIWYPDFDPQNPDASPSETFTYNSFGQVLEHRLTSGGTEIFAYDGRGLLTSYTPPATPSDQNPGSHPTRFFYDGNDRLWYTTDPFGNATWFEYNARGQVTKVTHQDGSFRQMGYNNDGTLAWSADENHPDAATEVNQRMRYVYDDYKRVVSVTNPLNQTTSFNYAQDWINSYVHTTSSVKGVFTPLTQTHFAYDENWRRTILRQAPGTADDAWTWSGYDQVGNLTSLQDPRGNVTTFAYDKRNRRISATKPAPFNDEIARWEYDDMGNVTKGIRPDLSFWRAEYDSMNRVIDTYGFEDEHTHFRRDLAGNVVEMKDPRNSSYFFTYDALNRKIGATYPPDAVNIVRSETWHYDAAGNMVEYKNRAGARKVYAPYDNRNRPTSFSWHDEAPGQSTQGQSFAFDAVGNITSLQNAEANLSFIYDAANRKTSETQTIKSYGLNQTHTVTYEYDEDGNRSRFVYPQGWDYRYAYTNRNQLASIRLAWSGTPSLQYAYDLAGNRSRRTIYYGAYTDYQFNEINQLRSQTSYFNGSTARFDYGFDDANRIKYEQRDSGAADGFSYNPGNELIGFNQNGTLNANGTVSAAYNVSITYDANGNRIDAFDGNNAHYNTAPNNQYSSDWTGALNYDDNANLITRAGWTFTYDAQNRLVKIQSGSTVIHYHYDPLNRIVARDTNGAITTQVWDGWNLIEEHEANGAFRRMYFHGAATNEIVASYGPAYGDAFYFQDGRGNVTHLTGPWNNVIERYTYFVSGQPNYLSGNSMHNRFLFQGALFVPEAEIYDMRNRFYHPNLGRFLQSDPIGFGGGDANLYRYCGNDPVNRSDPSGLQVTALMEEINVHSTFFPVDIPTGVQRGDFQQMFDRMSGSGSSFDGTDDIGRTSELPSIKIDSIPELLLRPDEEEAAETMGASDDSSPTAAGVENGSVGTGALRLGGALGVAGTIIGTVEQAYGGSGFWLGANFKFYPGSWGGNQYTGSRSRALDIGRAARFGGGVFFTAQAISSIRNMANTTDQYERYNEGMNLGVAGAGFLGPTGFATGLWYGAMDAAFGWRNIHQMYGERMQQGFWYQPGP